MAGPFIWGPEGTARSIASGSAVVGSTALSGNGEKNYVSNPSAAIDTTGWAISGGGTLARDTSASLPRLTTTQTGFAFTSTTDEEYVRTRFTLDAVDNSKKLKAVLAYYADSANFRIEVWKNSAADYTGSWTEFNLSTDSSGDSYLPIAAAVYQTTYDTDTTDYIELRIVHNTASSHTIYFSDVITGPGIQPQGAAVGSWTSFTPTGTWSSNTTYTGLWRRNGDTMELQVKVATSGAPTSAALSVNMPTGYTIDTTKLVETADNNSAVVGEASIRDEGTASFGGQVRYLSTSSVRVTYGDDASGGVAFSAVSETAPMTWANTDFALLKFRVPIAEWAGSVNLGQNDVEYAASTTGTWDAAAAAANTIYGPGGAPITGSLGAARTKVVRFQRPISATDRIVLQFSEDQITWFDVGQAGGGEEIMAYGNNDGVPFGVKLDRGSTTATDVDVQFQRYCARYTGSGAASKDWQSGNYWRLVKMSGGQAVGFGHHEPGVSAGLIRAEGVKGRTDSAAVAAGYVGELTGSVRAGTNGNSYSTTSSTAYPSSLGSLVSASVNKGRYLVSFASGGYSSAGDSSTEFYLYVGGTAVTTLMRGYATTSGVFGQIGCVPITITADSTAIALYGKVNGGLTITAPTHELWITRIA